MPPVDYKRKKLGDVFIDTVFEYGSNFVFPVGTESLTQTIPIQSDANFLCVHTVYEGGQVQATASTKVTFLNGGGLVVLTDGATQRALTNLVGGIPLSTTFGSAERPYMWPIPHLFRANTAISIQLVGSVPAATTIRLVFGGFKVPLGSVTDQSTGRVIA